MTLPFPNVPNVPGVPPLPRSPGAVFGAVELLVRDAVSSFSLGLTPQWGIFRNGAPVIVAQSVVSLDYKRDWSISDYPVEEGAFESYNKVTAPFDARFRFSSGGDELARQALLDSIDRVAGTLDLFDVVTPEVIYQSVNVMHYDYHRSATQGAGLLTVDVWCVQVRVTATSSFTKTASSADSQNVGTVQPTPATPAQENIVSNSGGGSQGFGEGGGGAGW